MFHVSLLFYIIIFLAMDSPVYIYIYIFFSELEPAGASLFVSHTVGTGK